VACAPISGSAETLTGFPSTCRSCIGSSPVAASCSEGFRKSASSPFPVMIRDKMESSRPFLTFPRRPKNKSDEAVGRVSKFRFIHHLNITSAFRNCLRNHRPNFLENGKRRGGDCLTYRHNALIKFVESEMELLTRCRSAAK
jgi:hypothetical protein